MVFDLGFFLYMNEEYEKENYEKKDTKNRSTEQNVFERENEAHNKENEDEK